MAQRACPTTASIIEAAKLPLSAQNGLCSLRCPIYQGQHRKVGLWQLKLAEARGRWHTKQRQVGLKHRGPVRYNSLHVDGEKTIRLNPEMSLLVGMF